MKLYLLDANENIIAMPPTKDLLSLIQDLKLKDTDAIEGALVVSKRYTSIMDNVRYIAVSDRDNDHAFYLYRKTMAEVQDRELIFDGKESFWDDLTGSYIKDKRPDAMLAPDLVKLILDGTRWNVDFVDSGFTETLDTNFYYQSRSDALSSVMSAMTIDIVPMINIEDNTITRRYVNLYLQAGGDNGRRFVYGKNALSVVKKTDDSQVFTALVGRGKSIEQTSTDTETGETTTYNTPKINFADVEWSKAAGDPVDKPKGQEYVEWPESTKLYGYSNGNPRIGIVDFDNDDDPAQLLKDTWAQLQTTGVPSVQFSATVGDVGYLAKGETVTIVNYVKGIAYKTRVTELKWNRLAEAKSQLTIGDKLVQNANERMASIATQQSNASIQAAVQTIAKQAANLVTVTNAFGVNVSWSKDGTMPPEPKEGDIVYIRNDDGTITVKSYKDGQWVIIVDDTTGQQIQKKVDAKMDQLNADMSTANANLQVAKQDVDDLQDKLKANDDAQAQLSKDLAANSQLVTQNKTDVDAALVTVNENLTQAKTDAETAVKKADDAVANAKSSADASGLSATSAQAASDAATAAKDLAMQAANDIATAKDQANNAADNASAALDKAKSALATANGVSDNYKSIKQIVDDTSGTIKTLATSASVDAVSGRVTKAQSLAEKTANGLTLKADSSTVDAINHTVKQQGIDLKAAQDELKLKLTQSDLTQGLNGYATQTWAQNQINVTAQGWETQLSSVQSKYDDFTSAGANLLLDAGFESGTIGQASQYWVGGATVVGNSDTSNGVDTSSKCLQIPGLPGRNNDVHYRYLLAVDQKDYRISVKTRWNANPQGGTIIIYAFEYDANKALIAPRAIIAQTGANNWTVLSETYTPLASARYVQWDVTYNGATETTPIYVDDWWFGADYATSTQFADIKASVDGFSTTFAKQTDLESTNSNLKVASDGLDFVTAVTGKKGENVAQVIADVKKIQTTMTGANGYTTRLQTLEGFQSTATNDIKGIKSQQTLMANQWTSIVGDLGNMVRGGDFEDQVGGQPSPYWSANGANVSTNFSQNSVNTSATCLQITGLESGNRDVWFNDFFKVDPAKQYRGTFKTRWNSVTQNGAAILYAIEYDANKTRIKSVQIVNDTAGGTSGHNWQKFGGTYAPSADCAYIRLVVTYNGALGTSPIWVDDIDFREDLASGSQITQMKGLIDARVDVDGKITAALSLSADGGGTVTIRGANLYVTADSHFDDASIKSAAIANLDAKKITSGSISSDRLVTTKLNADNITSGTIAAERLAATKISATNIVGGTFDAGTMTVKHLSADMIASGTIDASLLSTTKLNATNITAGTLDLENLEVKNLNASLIVGGELDASKMNVINLNASAISAGTITADKLATDAMLIGLNNSLSSVNITPSSITINPYDANLSSLTLNPTDGLMFSKGSNSVAGLHAGYTGKGLTGLLVMDQYLQPSGQGFRWGKLNSATDADILMSLYPNEAQANTQGHVSGLDIATNVTFHGNIYSRSATTSADPHLHFSNMTGMAYNGIALLNDVNSGIEIDNDGSVYLVIRNVRYTIATK